MKAMVKYTFFLSAVMLLLLHGCSMEKEIGPHKQTAEMKLNGSIKVESKSGWINPAPSTTLPPRQISIGVAMLDYDTPDPNTEPAASEWNGVVEWKRAYFGGPGLQTGGALASFTPTNGEIKFTNDDGTATNKVFYNENGFWRFLRAFHPWDGAAVVPETNGGSILMPINGSHDIMCSNMVWGCAEPKTFSSPPYTYTPQYVNTVLNFSHLLTKLNIRLVAENAVAKAQYGEIVAIEVINQPQHVLVNIATGALEPASLPKFRYGLVDFATGQTLPEPAISNPDPFLDAKEFGYVMVIPAEKYTVRIETELRLAFYMEVIFPAVTLPGMAYNVTLQFMETEEIFIYAEEAPEWWMDSTFN